MDNTFPTDDPRWDLDSIFEGGVESPSFFREVEALEEAIEKLSAQLGELDRSSDAAIDEEHLLAWRRFLDNYFEVMARAWEAGAFSRALASAHTDVPEAMRMPSRLDDVTTGLDQIKVQMMGRIAALSETDFQVFVEDRRFSDATLWLEELRQDGLRSMGTELEELAVELNRDGFHAWSRLYFEVSGRLEVQVPIEDEEQTFSVGQAKNLLDSADRTVRRAAYEGLQRTWGDAAPICASVLNALRGTERTFYERRGGDCLTDALLRNRVERSSVEAMFGAAEKLRPLLVRYLQAKASLLGLHRLEWFDLSAPVGKEHSHIDYGDAQRFIVEQVEAFSPKIATFCRHALAEQWVEVEDRAGKRQGGYCTTLPVSKQIRIFMTYGGTNSGVTTLAHELGHGYHSEVMKDLPISQRRISMGLAETASTFLETLVEQATLRRADESQRLALLDERLNRAVTFLMNIHARYQLELEMHRLRNEETLHQELLSQVTRRIFEDVYGDGVASVDELFWASKLHFYMSYLSFYNFPYTFGYLFARAVYARAMEVGDEFVDQIDQLLIDTGRMRSEELAQKHLDADLGDENFWIRAAGSLKEDVEQYEQLAARQSR